MMFSTRDGITAVSAAVSTLVGNTPLAWIVAAGGHFAADRVDPQQHALVTVNLGDEDLGPIKAEHLDTAGKIVEAFGHSAGWMMARPLLRKLPKPAAAIAGAGLYVAMSHGAQMLGQFFNATKAAQGSQSEFSADLANDV